MKKIIALTLVVALVSGFAFMPTQVAMAASLTAPVTGTFTDALGGTGTFVGQFTGTRFSGSGGVLSLTGTLTGTLTDSAGTLVGSVTQTVTFALSATGTCEILDLSLGPIDLDLLGLVVHIDEINIDIVAQSGPGNLLGNLLCGIAGLLDSNAPATTLARLLNQLLGLL